jgi:hypothetical protein
MDYTMSFHHDAFPPQAPSSTEQPPPPPPTKKSRKTLYVVIGTIAVVAVVLAAVFVFEIPQSQGATIPLTYNYTVGENMVYNITMVIIGSTVNSTGNPVPYPVGTSTNMTEAETASMDIVSFDGENYTINYTTVIVWNGITLGPDNGTEMINKTGYVTILSGPTTGYIYYVLGQFSIPTFFQKNQAKVRETWQFPISQLGNASSGVTGNETFTFGDIQNVDVPAGTYKAFNMNFSSTDITVSPLAYGQLYTMHARLNGQAFLEYGTCHLIDFNYQGNVYYEVNGQNFSSSSSTHAILVNDTKP